MFQDIIVSRIWLKFQISNFVEIFVYQISLRIQSFGSREEVPEKFLASPNSFGLARYARKDEECHEKSVYSRSFDFRQPGRGAESKQLEGCLGNSFDRNQREQL